MAQIDVSVTQKGEWQVPKPYAFSTADITESAFHYHRKSSIGLYIPSAYKLTQSPGIRIIVDTRSYTGDVLPFLITASILLHPHPDEEMLASVAVYQMRLKKLLKFSLTKNSDEVVWSTPSVSVKSVTAL